MRGWVYGGPQPVQGTVQAPECPVTSLPGPHMGSSSLHELLLTAVTQEVRCARVALCAAFQPLAGHRMALAGQVISVVGPHLRSHTCPSERRSSQHVGRGAAVALLCRITFLPWRSHSLLEHSLLECFVEAQRRVTGFGLLLANTRSV